MVSELFLLQLLLSFIIGGLAVATAISFAEKFGSKAGALILSIPTTSFVGLFFIGLTNSAGFAASVAPFSIISLSIMVIFLLSFLYLIGKFGRTALFLSLIIWFALAFLVLNLPTFDIATSLAVFILIYVAGVYCSVKKQMHSETAKSSSFFIHRAIIAGLVISTAVLLAKTMGQAWGGLFSMFPASTTSSLWILSESNKKEFVVSVAVRLLLLLPIFVFYSLSVYVFYPLLDIYLGTAVCFLLVLGFAYLLNKIMN